MMDELERALAAEQREDGAFRARVQWPDHAVDDWNGFVTAHVVRALRRRDPTRPSRARERALDFLGRCRSQSGTCNHWPPGDRPAWVGALPDDADDTAIVTVELLIHGRIDRAEARRIALELTRHRLGPLRAPHPPWFEAGAFLTWLARGRPNLVDACVNANVVGLLAELGLHDAPGFAAACTLVARAVGFVAGHPPSAREGAMLGVAPFYPQPAELDLAVAHAVEHGAVALAGLPVLAPGAPELDPVVCSGAYGRPRWRCRAVGLARSGVPPRG